MHSPVGKAAVRLSLGMLLCASLAMAFAQPVQAGSEAAPEIADPANDQAVLGEVPISQQPPAGTTVGLSVDLLLGYVSEADADNFVFTVGVQGTGGASSTSEQEWRFFFTIAGTEYVASARVGIANVAGTYSAGGVTSEVVAEGDGFIHMTVPKASVGSPAPGSVLTNLFAEAESILGGEVPGYITDRAPNEGAGSDFTMADGSGGGGACPNCTADDTDGDGLNDTWEQQHFGNLTQDAAGDPDGDGLTNGQEEALGTDPTKADTDGDGVDDDEDPYPLDPTRGGSSSNGTTTTTSSSSSTTGGGGGTTTGGSTGGSGGDGDVKSLADAVERLESDLGYVGMSAGGFLAVLILCVVALAVRWSL